MSLNGCRLLHPLVTSLYNLRKGVINMSIAEIYYLLVIVDILFRIAERIEDAINSKSN